MKTFNPATSENKITKASWKTKAALAVGVGVPLGIMASADPASAFFGSRSPDTSQSADTRSDGNNGYGSTDDKSENGGEFGGTASVTNAKAESSSRSTTTAASQDYGNDQDEGHQSTPTKRESQATENAADSLGQSGFAVNNAENEPAVGHTTTEHPTAGGVTTITKDAAGNVVASSYESKSGYPQVGKLTSDRTHTGEGADLTVATVQASLVTPDGETTSLSGDDDADSDSSPSLGERFGEFFKDLFYDEAKPAPIAEDSGNRVTLDGDMPVSVNYHPGSLWGSEQTGEFANASDIGSRDSELTDGSSASDSNKTAGLGDLTAGDPSTAREETSNDSSGAEYRVETAHEDSTTFTNTFDGQGNLVAQVVVVPESPDGEPGAMAATTFRNVAGEQQVATVVTKGFDRDGDPQTISFDRRAVLGHLEAEEQAVTDERATGQAAGDEQDTDEPATGQAAGDEQNTDEQDAGEETTTEEPSDNYFGGFPYDPQASRTFDELPTENPFYQPNRPQLAPYSDNEQLPTPPPRPALATTPAQLTPTQETAATAEPTVQIEAATAERPDFTATETEPEAIPAEPEDTATETQEAAPAEPEETEAETQEAPDEPEGDEEVENSEAEEADIPCSEKLETGAAGAVTCTYVTEDGSVIEELKVGENGFGTILYGPDGWLQATTLTAPSEIAGAVDITTTTYVMGTFDIDTSQTITVDPEGNILSEVTTTEPALPV